MSRKTFIPRLHLAASALRTGNPAEATEAIKEELKGGMTLRQISAYLTDECSWNVTEVDLKDLLGRNLKAHLSRGVYDAPHGRAVDVACVHFWRGTRSAYVYMSNGPYALNLDKVRGGATWTSEEDVYGEDVPSTIFDLCADGYKIIGAFDRSDMPEE